MGLGNDGAKLIGKFASKGGSAAPWKIIGAEKTQESPEKWEYTLDMEGLGQKKVGSDDLAWNVKEVVVDPKVASLREYLSPRISEPVNGVVAGWLTEDDNKFKISPCIKMDEERTSDGEIKYLWSGGAADCVIIAAHSVSQKKAYLTHATRMSATGAAGKVLALAVDVKVYLSSQYFSRGAETAAYAGTVREIVDALKEKGTNIVACYGSGWLALNANTGAVFSKFKDPFEKKESSAKAPIKAKTIE